ncbi:hypothetical protein DFH08DRAFT_963173 [Mycena albidolilacea]|uniref:Uncharacterized protein n=1 Tax=Mycena albidolilacea TaxID=1033008 RepID=A0AAD6ZVG0_9AGAR|nr:hypothetical protein DFH08DRAFT_963173 [Mycena albidolilacea]
MLPPELASQIFEFAAFLNPECLLQLVLIFLTVQHRMQPLLYLTLAIHPRLSQSHLPRFSLSAVIKLSTSQPEVLRKYTRHACLVNIQPAHPTAVVGVLSRCLVTVDLALIRTVWWKDYTDILSALSLQRFSFCPRPMVHGRSSPDFFDGSLPVFSKVTHLDIDAHWRDWG